MNEKVVGRLKASGAECYEVTRKNILARMVKGNLIHADETRIKLHGKSAYVWFLPHSTKWHIFIRKLAKEAFSKRHWMDSRGFWFPISMRRMTPCLVPSKSAFFI